MRYLQICDLCQGTKTILKSSHACGGDDKRCAKECPGVFRVPCPHCEQIETLARREAALIREIEDLRGMLDKWTAEHDPIMLKNARLRSLVGELAAIMKRGMAALAHQDDPIEVAAVMGEILGRKELE